MVDVPVEAVMAAARAAGIVRAVTVGTTLESSRWSARCAEDHEGVYAAVAIHPNDTEGVAEAVLADIEALAARPRVVAVGETGLDYYRDRAPRELQARAFVAQIELARELGKPLVIHTRAAEQQTLDQLAAEADGVTVVMHCFSMPGRLAECLGRGYQISFAGNVTYPSSAQLAEAAERVPEGQLLIETDAPYLTPQAVRRERNQPAFVVHTGRFIARLRGLEPETLGEALQRNAARIFGWR
jgi:TatD DNase family protein